MLKGNEQTIVAIDENIDSGERRRKEIYLQEKRGSIHGVCGHASAFFVCLLG